MSGKDYLGKVCGERGLLFSLFLLSYFAFLFILFGSVVV